MSEPTVYLNGEYVPKSSAVVSVEDRGLMFGDGVYEVLQYCNGRAFRLQAHLDRLHRSLAGIRLNPPEDVARLGEISDELIRLNAVPDAKVYWQVTRGVGPRDRLFPAEPSPTVLAMAYPGRPLDLTEPPATMRVMLHADIRWTQCWIKTLNLLGSVLARQAADDAGCDDAILHRDGVVTESTAANLFIVRDGELWTHPADQWILAGITRGVLLQAARELSIAVHEQTFTADHLLAADEAMLVGTTTHVAAIVDVGGQMIGDGKIGPVTRQLHQALRLCIADECGVHISA